MRTCVNRLADEGGHTIAGEMAEVDAQGVHHFTVGADDVAELELKYKRIRVLPSIGKKKRYPTQTLTVIHARERGEPTGRSRIEWKLITDLPVNTPIEAIEKLEWYAQRWKIETFHKILKSGCRAVDAKLRTAERLVNLIAVLCIRSWRIFWLTMINRAVPMAPPQLALTEIEIATLDHLRLDKEPNKQKSLSDYILKIARLGG